MTVQATWRMVLLLVTALVVVAVMSVAVMAATPAFAQGPGGSENSCGASNPNIGDFPPNRENKGEETGSGEFVDCGFRNNPHISGVPPGQEN
jgi:hypothetical protein